MDRREFIRLSAQATALASMGAGLDAILRSERAHAYLDMSGAGNQIFIDVDPTLGPASAPSVDMSQWMVQGYLMNEGVDDRTVGLRIYEQAPDGSATPGQHEIRKVLTLAKGADATIDDLATVPILPTGGVVTGQIPEYWAGLMGIGTIFPTQPDMPHTFYFDTNGSHDAEGKAKFQEIIENFNVPATGYESVMTRRITENVDFVGSGEWNNPTYPVGFDSGSFRNSVVIFDSSAPTNGAYDPNTKVLFLNDTRASVMKQEVGRALFGVVGTIHSADGGDPTTNILDYDKIALRVSFDSDIQGGSGETGFIRSTELYTPNSRDGSGVFPGDLPAEQEMAPAPVDANGSAVYNIAGQPIPTSKNSVSRLKGSF